MSVFVIVLLMVVNFAISWWNAVAVGNAWTDAKAAGGWSRFMAWCGATMAACGFSWVFLFILAFIAHGLQLMPDKYFTGALELGYVIIILPLLGSGLAIWADSIATAWRERSISSIGVAAWNTYAEFSNIRNAVSELPGIFKDLGDLFSGSGSGSGSGSSDDDDDKAKGILLMIVIVAVALAAGILLTTYIIRRQSAKRGMELRRMMDDHRRAEAA